MSRPATWQALTKLFLRGKPLRPVQQAALQAGLLSSRKNFLVSAPTNAGKTLVGLLPMLEALRKGRRAVLLEPLRELAQEQTDSLREMAPMLGEAMGAEFRVSISTGDYRLEDEHFTEPLAEGELIVATPERFEAILRNPEYQDWIDSIGCVCVDEAHLISTPHRGPTLEFVIGSLLGLPRPPRLVLLSATLGDTSAARAWLRPCEFVEVRERVPPLCKDVLKLEEGQGTNELVIGWLRQALAESDAQAIVFVYQTAAAEALARFITEQLKETVGPTGAVAFHSKMSTATRRSAKEAYMRGDSRVVVATTSLAMGVNLPATHVLVRDLTFPKARSPEVGDLLQMMGRAGRGDTPGTAAVLLRPNDNWSYEQLRSALQEEKLPPFRSSFEAEVRRLDEVVRQVEKLVAALLSRHQDAGLSASAIKRILGNSLGGQRLTDHVEHALQDLCDKKIAFADSTDYRLTKLGLAATRAVLPVDVAAGFAQLIRDLLASDPKDQVIGDWKPFDQLLVAELLNDRSPNLQRFTPKLEEQISAWMERHAGASALFGRWVHGAESHSRAEELLGSLGVEFESEKVGPGEAARAVSYKATLNAIVLSELGSGVPIRNLARQFDLKKLEGIEERWRDTLLWLLHGLAQLLDIRCFFFHLNEECQADPQRIRRVKDAFARMKYMNYELQERLKYCSPLGPLLADIRRVSGKNAGVGIQSIRKLEESGITDMGQLATLGVEGMVGRGVRRDIAKRITGYVRRRAH